MLEGSIWNTYAGLSPGTAPENTVLYASAAGMRKRVGALEGGTNRNDWGRFENLVTLCVHLRLASRPSVHERGLRLKQHTRESRERDWRNKEDGKTKQPRITLVSRKTSVGWGKGSPTAVRRTNCVGWNMGRD